MALNDQRQVAVLVGSLRKESLNRKLAHVLAALAPPTLALEEVTLDGLPVYNQDDEATPAPAVEAFKARIRSADALLFVTPEYNRSVPGMLKNAIDIGSRPYGQSAWSGKPGGVITLSPGAAGGFGANHHLRQMMVFLDVPMMAQPEAYIGGAGSLFDAEGGIAKPDTREFLQKWLAAFERWIERFPGCLIERKPCGSCHRTGAGGIA